MKTPYIPVLPTKQLSSPSALFPLFKTSLQALNRSPRTISWYLEVLQHYSDFLTNTGNLKPVEELGKAELEKYLLHLQKTTKWLNRTPSKDYGKLSPYFIQGQVRGIKRFWSWLTDEGYITKNPLGKFPLPKAPKKLIPVMSIEQLKQLLKAINVRTPAGARNNLLILLLMDTGLRLGEVVAIQLSDIDLVQGYIKVVGKGQKQRVVPFSKHIRKGINSYRKNTRPALCTAASPYLFPEENGEHITLNAVEQAIRRLAARAGLTGTRIYAHLFRHTFGSQFIAKGGSTFALKEILGHESIQTTQQYVHLQTADLQKEHTKYTPLDDVLGK